MLLETGRPKRGPERNHARHPSSGYSNRPFIIGHYSNRFHAQLDRIN